MTAPGFILSLSRDDAKSLFSNKDAESVASTVDGFLNSEELKRDNRLLNIEQLWKPIHRCLTDGSLEPQAGEPPLNQVILGGRPLYHEQDRFVMLVRPDMVRHIAEALNNAAGEMQSKFEELPCDSLEESATWPAVEAAIQRIASLYATAAAQGHAVVFTAKR